MNFDWILFDADHTLFDFDRSAAEALAQTISGHGIDHHDSHWERYDAINKQCWAAFENGEMDRETMRTRRFTLFFEEFGHGDVDIEIFAREYLHELPRRPYFIDGAIELLDLLQGKTRLGMITNGLAEVQRPRFVSTGIDRYFEVIVISGEINMMKPDHAFFAHTFELMGRPEKERVLVVGDSLNADIRGGTQFGFKTCWYNPAQTLNDSGTTPDYEIEQLDLLRQIIGF